MTPLTDRQRQRYDRQILLPDIGEAGQERLLVSNVLVVGVGGLGSSCAYYLAAAGVGTIGLVDGDIVDLSNLQRQILHTTDDLDWPKTESAAAKLRALNPDVEIEEYGERLGSHNAIEIVSPYDMAVDCTDNFATKYLLNDACFLVNLPFVHAGVSGFAGQAMTIGPQGQPCLRCLMPDPPPDPEPGTPEKGILGAVAGAMGCVEACEVIKLLVGVGSPLYGSLLSFDALTFEVSRHSVPANPECPLCGENRSIFSLKEDAK